MLKRIFSFWGDSVLLILLAIGVYFALNSNFSNDREKLTKGLDQRYVQAMAADTYGGKTPQETLDLFVAALRANDADLAARYFMLDNNSSRDKWVRTLNILKGQGVLAKIAGDIKLSSVHLELNSYSGVWKIVNFY